MYYLDGQKEEIHTSPPGPDGGCLGFCPPFQSTRPLHGRRPVPGGPGEAFLFRKLLVFCWHLIENVGTIPEGVFYPPNIFSRTRTASGLTGRANRKSSPRRPSGSRPRTPISSRAGCRRSNVQDRRPSIARRPASHPPKAPTTPQDALRRRH